MTDSWLKPVTWSSSADAEWLTQPAQQQQAGRTVRKRRRSKSRLVDAMADETITFARSEASDTKPTKKQKGEARQKPHSQTAPPSTSSKKSSAKRTPHQAHAADSAEERHDPAVPDPTNLTKAQPGSRRDASAKQQSMSKAAKSTDTTPQRSKKLQEAGQQGAAGGAQSVLTAGGKLGKMRAQLQGGRFRMLNEQLYTTQSSTALELMQADPTLFDAYHDGFRAQTQRWTVKPVDVALKWLRKQSGVTVVADLGCGDAQVAKALQHSHTVLSFDLVAHNEFVTACNMADVPCEAGTCDAAILSLALMGIDYPSFIREAARILKSQGRLWIAEVRSRFVPDSKDTEDFEPFLEAMRHTGFKLVNQDIRNRMFVVWVFRKSSAPVADVEWPLLKPCIYKRR